MFEREIMLMKSPLVLFIVLALAAIAGMPEPATRADEPVDEVELLIQRLDEARENINRLEARVVHERVVEVMELEEKYEGSFLFEKPHLLRMELKEAAERGRERVYIVGKDIAWIVHPGRKQAEKAPIMTEGLGVETQRQQNPFTYGLTHGIGELRKTFDMRIIGEDRIGEYETHILELTGRLDVMQREGRVYPRTIFWIDKESGLPVRVRQFKSRGQIVETYTLSNMEINPRAWLPRFRSPFEYNPPRDYQVIEYGAENL